MGKASPLLSSFKLTYYTLLNLMRRLEGSGQDMEYVIKRSFQQFQYESRLPQVTHPPSLLQIADMETRIRGRLLKRVLAKPAAKTEQRTTVNRLGHCISKEVCNARRVPQAAS